MTLHYVVIEKSESIYNELKKCSVIILSEKGSIYIYYICTIYIV